MLKINETNFVFFSWNNKCIFCTHPKMYTFGLLLNPDFKIIISAFIILLMIYGTQD